MPILNPVHILNQMGVITSFSIAKKIPEEEITKFFTKGKKAGKSVADLNRLLREKVLSEIEDAVSQSKVPGLLLPEELAKEMGVQPTIITNMPELNRLLMAVGNNLIDKKYDKMSLCYFINALVNLLGLSESDFENFHRQNNGEDNSDDNTFGSV